MQYTRILRTVVQIYTRFYQHNPDCLWELQGLQTQAVKQRALAILNESYCSKQKVYTAEDYCQGQNACNQLYCNDNQMNSYDTLII